MAISERPVPQVIHRYEDPYKHSSSLKAFVNNERVGYMEYVRNYDNGGWNIENVIVDEGAKGKGIGQALIRSFVEHVGPDQTVQGAIIHEATYKALVERFSNGLEPGEKRDVPVDDLPSLAMVRFLKFCGIEVTKITVGTNLPEIEDILCNVEFQGRTF